MSIRSIISSLQGTKLTDKEVGFFKEFNPLGFILFARNIVDYDQVRALCSELRNMLNRDNVLILIDQEGGRVRRLKKPNFTEYPAASFFRDIAVNQDLELAKKFVYFNTLLMANDLVNLGINVNCAPVTDLLIPGADAIISDRSYGTDVNQVVELAKSVAQGYLDSKIWPIIKHIPGHGRALVDSHFDLPVIDTNLDELNKTDFAVFRKLSFLPIAMTAHIVFKEIDPDLPVTLSPDAIKYIRNEIGFNNLLITDDLAMKALKGDLTDIANSAVKAGCDLLLHCNGDLEEMISIAPFVPSINNRIKEVLNWSHYQCKSNIKEMIDSFREYEKII